VARTVNIANRTVRQDAFIDIAEQLFRTRGYEQTSIQDILDAVGASRGAFYHYFGSKTELLEAVVDRMVLMATGTASPIVDDPTLRAAEKLRGIFESISSWKLARADLMQAMLEAWVSDDNALMREKYRRHVSAALMPLLTRIAEQGIAEGSFRASSATGVARTVVHLLLGFQDEVLELIVAARDEALDFDQVWASVSSFPTVFDQAAGLPPGTFPAVDKGTLREWLEANRARHTKGVPAT